MTIKQLPPLEFLVTAIEALKKSREQTDKWQDTFNEMFDGHLVPMYTSSLEAAIIKMVELAFNDEPHPDYGSIFSWWVYDCELGTRKDLLNSLTVKGKKVPVTTPEELYNYYNLINNSDN